jgi:hypothetical protein
VLQKRVEKKKKRRELGGSGGSGGKSWRTGLRRKSGSVSISKRADTFNSTLFLLFTLFYNMPNRDVLKGEKYRIAFRK